MALIIVACVSALGIVIIAIEENMPIKSINENVISKLLPIAFICFISLAFLRCRRILMCYQSFVMQSISYFSYFVREKMTEMSILQNVSGKVSQIKESMVKI